MLLESEVEEGESEVKGLQLVDDMENDGVFPVGMEFEDKKVKQGGDKVFWCNCTTRGEQVEVEVEVEVKVEADTDVDVVEAAAGAFSVFCELFVIVDKTKNVDCNCSLSLSLNPRVEKLESKKPAIL